MKAIILAALLAALSGQAAAQVVRASSGEFQVHPETARLERTESGIMASAVVTFRDYQSNSVTHNEWRATGCDPHLSGGYYTSGPGSARLWMKAGTSVADGVLFHICAAAIRNLGGGV